MTRMRNFKLFKLLFIVVITLEILMHNKYILLQKLLKMFLEKSHYHSVNRNSL